jgi:MoaD family protein
VTVKVRFFAVLKSLVGKSELSLDIEEGSTFEQILGKLKAEFPPLDQIMKEGKILISVNQDVVEAEYLLKDGDEIAFLPPFAGGSVSHESPHFLKGLT